jgi:hypothetical protein
MFSVQFSSLPGRSGRYGWLAWSVGGLSGGLGDGLRRAAVAHGRSEWEPLFGGSSDSVRGPNGPFAPLGRPISARTRCSVEERRQSATVTSRSSIGAVSETSHFAGLDADLPLLRSGDENVPLRNGVAFDVVHRPMSGLFFLLRRSTAGTYVRGSLPSSLQSRSTPTRVALLPAYISDHR